MHPPDRAETNWTGKIVANLLAAVCRWGTQFRAKYAIAANLPVLFRRWDGSVHQDQTVVLVSPLLLLLMLLLWMSLLLPLMLTLLMLPDGSVAVDVVNNADSDADNDRDGGGGGDPNTLVM